MGVKIGTGTGTGAAVGTAIMPGIGTAIGAGAGFLADNWDGIFGGGDSPPPPDPYQVDANAYGPLAVDMNQYNQAAQAAQQRQAAQIDQGQGTNLYGDYQNQLQARQGQQQMIGNLQDAAAGRGPSVVQATLAQGQRDANNQALSMANSARGGSGAQALAARTAMQQQAANNMNGANQAAILKAQEQQNAYGQLGAALQAQRGGDINSRAQSASIAGQNMGAQMQQRGMNDQYSMANTNVFMQGLNANRDAAIRLQEQNAANYNAAHNYAAQNFATQTTANHYQDQSNQQWLGAAANAYGSGGIPGMFNGSGGGGGSYGGGG